MEKLTSKQKIIACYGNLNNKSIAKVVGCDLQMVYYYLKVSNLKYERNKRYINPYINR